jgi:hypothetical protein
MLVPRYAFRKQDKHDVLFQLFLCFGNKRWMSRKKPKSPGEGVCILVLIPTQVHDSFSRANNSIPLSSAYLSQRVHEATLTDFSALSNDINGSMIGLSSTTSAFSFFFLWSRVDTKKQKANCSVVSAFSRRRDAQVMQAWLIFLDMKRGEVC